MKTFHGGATTIALLCLLLMGCRDRPHPSEVLSEAGKLADSIPSQALIKLEEIKKVKKLSAAEQAEHRLIFINSMIRSGNKLASDSIIHAATRYYRQQDDSAHVHQTLYYNGIYHYRNANYDSAVVYFNEAAETVPSGSDIGRKAINKRMAGYAYLYLGETGQAVNTQKEALFHSHAANDSLSVIYSLLSLAEAYKYNKETDQSLETYMQAIELIREKEYHDMEANILNVVSGIYESDNRIKEALTYKNKAQEVKRKRKDIPATNLYRAILFGKQNRIDSARYYVQLSIKGDDPFVADLGYVFLSILEEKEGRYLDALNLSKNSEEMFNSFSSQAHHLEMQQKYEKEKLENENNQLKIKQKEHQLYLLLSAFIILMMLIVLYILRVNSKRKNEKTAHQHRMHRLQQENLLLKQQQEISTLREKEAVLRESVFRRIDFFNKVPSLNREENGHHANQGKIKITRDDWQELTSSIQDAYPDFLYKLKQHAPTLSDDDVRFCCLLKINVNMQDLSDIYCVSKAAITKRKYRLKTEKFQVDDTHVNLDAVLQQMG